MSARRVAVLRTSRGGSTGASSLVAPVLSVLDGAGHQVTDLAVAGGEPVDLAGQQVVVLLGPAHPSLSAHHAAWREWDRWYATTVPWLTSVARSAGVRRLVLQSSALLYADGGASVVDERSPLAVTAATEPWCAAETATHRFADGSHTSVVLRLAPMVDDAAVTPWLRAAAARPGSCPQVRWQPRTTTADAARAVLDAVHCAGGIYNVGDADTGSSLAEASAGPGGRWWTPPPVGRLLPWRERTGERLEPFGRSVRLSTAKLARTTGWHPSQAGAGARA